MTSRNSSSTNTEKGRSAAASTASRRALVVLGMHRSGTSALARVISLLGATLPNRLMPASVANPRGYFESVRLFELHEEIMRSAGTSWFDLAPFPADWIHSPIADGWVDRLAEALAIVAEVVLEPAFPEAEIERVRDQRMASLRQRRMSPSALADDLLGHLVYPADHPYGRPSSGVADAVSSFDRPRAMRWHHERYRPRGSGLVVVGDVDPGEVEALASRAFGSWSGHAAAPVEGAFDAAGPDRSRIVVAHRPGAVQSEVRIGTVGVDRKHEDFFPLQILNTTLGGAFTSRLNLNLRERNGFTYGVRSRFSFRRGPGPFTISTAVGTDVTVAAVREALGEVHQLMEAGPRDDEVSAARDFLAGIFPLQLETSDRIAAQITRLKVYGLPDDHLSTYRERIRAVTVQDALAAGRRVLHEAPLVVLVVGDADQIRAGLEALGHGSVEVLTDDSLPSLYP